MPACKVAQFHIPALLISNLYKLNYILKNSELLMQTKMEEKASALDSPEVTELSSGWPVS